MRRTLRICRTAWTRYGNCPDRPLPVLPQSDSRQECRPVPSFSFSRKHRGGRFRFQAGRKSRLSRRSRDNAFGNRTHSQPRLRGCSKGLGRCPNKQKLRFPASPGTAVSSLCGNKDTACEVAHNRLYELWTIRFFLRKAFAPLLPSEFPVVARSYKR